MNGNAELLAEDVQSGDVFDEILVVSDIQSVPVSIAENILTASDSPKHTLSNNKTKSKKVKLRESVETSDTSEKLLEALKETLHEGDTDEIFSTYVASELSSLDGSRQRIGKVEITNSLKRTAMSQFCGNVSSEPSANIQQQYLNNTNGSAATPQSASWVKSFTDFLNF